MDGGSKFRDCLPDFRLPVSQTILLFSMLCDPSWFTEEQRWEWSSIASRRELGWPGSGCS